MVFAATFLKASSEKATQAGTDSHSVHIHTTDRSAKKDGEGLCTEF